MPHQQFTDWEPKGQAVKYLLASSIQVLDEYAGLAYAITLLRVSPGSATGCQQASG